MSHRISEELERMTSLLEKNYHITSRTYNTTIIRNAKREVINAFDEICGLKAKSLDDKIDLTIEFHLAHETPEDGNRIKAVIISPVTQESKERVYADISSAYSKFKG